MKRSNFFNAVSRNLFQYSSLLDMQENIHRSLRRGLTSSNHVSSRTIFVYNICRTYTDEIAVCAARTGNAIYATIDLNALNAKHS